MAIHPIAATWTTIAGNKTVSESGGGFVNGDLVVAICANSGRTTAQPPTVTDDKFGGTYTRHGTAATKATSADSMWVFVRDNLWTAGAGTFVVTMTQASDSGGGLDVFIIQGISRCGLNAIRQVGKQDNQAAGTPSITMGSAILTGSTVLGAVFTTSNVTTNTAPPATPTYTEDTDLGYNTPASGLETVHVITGETRTTVPWTAATPTGFCSLLVEFDMTIPVVPEFLTEPRRPWTRRTGPR